jgi:hypothetical protein
MIFMLRPGVSRGEKSGFVPPFRLPGAFTQRAGDMPIMEGVWLGVCAAALHSGLGLFVLGFLAFPCFRVGMQVLPLCGAALPFFAAAKKGSKESRSNR